MLLDILYLAQQRNLPQSLRDTKCWTLGRRTRGKNRAYRLNGHTQARSNHPEDWHDFESCISAARDLPQVDHLHIATGACLGNGLVTAGFDFDHCVCPDTNELDTRVAAIVRQVGSYYEYSPSGTGIRILVTAPKGIRNIANPQQGFEFYAGKHFLSVCGRTNGLFRDRHADDARPLRNLEEVDG